MSSETAQKQPDQHSPPGHQAPEGEEHAPSRLNEDEFSFARILGLIGMGLALLGAVLMFVSIALAKPVWVLYLGMIGVGILLMLVHSFSDSEPQVARAYGIFGVSLLILAGLFALLPGGPDRSMGFRFLSMGLPALILALLFLLAYVRQESDEDLRKFGMLLMFGLGAAFTVGMIVVGAIYPPFVFGTGGIMALVGLIYLCTFINHDGAATGLGYKASLGLGILGGLTILFVIVRSLIPVLTDSGATYFVPSGLTLLMIGLLYVGMSLLLLSDLQVLLIFRRELASFFYSPVAYLVFLGIAVLGWYNYVSFLSRLGQLIELRGSVAEPILRDYFVSLVPVIAVIFAVPIVTMRTFAEERRTGTMEVLMTAPVTEWAIVLGKFLAAYVFYMILWVPWLLFPLAMQTETGVAFDYRPVLTFYLSMGACGAAFVSMGVFFSALTRNQIIAAVISFVVMVAYVMFFLWAAEEFEIGQLWRALFQRINFISLWIESGQGRLMVRDMLVYLSITLFWLFATTKVLEARKWS